MALQSISNFCGTNLPGLYSIEYAPTTWIDADVYRQRLSGHVWSSGIPFSQGGWLTAPVFYRPDQLWQQNQIDDQQGRSYESTTTGSLPQMRVEIDEQFEQMPNYQYLLRLKDRNNKYWLLGTLETPFLFSTGNTSGNNSQRNQYTINFQAVLPQRVFGLVV
ncbi:MAG: hypothetical protein AAFO02_00540 [Bacteroidota bacterium]